MVDARGVHVGQAALAEVLDAFDDALRPRIGVVQQVVLEDVEADVLVRACGELFSVQGEHFRWRVRLLGGDAQVSLSSSGGQNRFFGCH